jgi:PTS system fructose-specific IIC component
MDGYADMGAVMLETPAIALGAVEPFLLLGIILVAGTVGGWLARRVRVPAVTGYILTGVLIGPSCLGLVQRAGEGQSLELLSTFAMGLITINIGGHLSYRRIHNALGRIAVIALLEVAAAVSLVVIVARLLGADWPLALLLGAVSAATAPGTTIALIRDNRAKGSFVKTLLSVVALDNILCIFLFAAVRTLLADYYTRGGTLPPLDHAVYQSARQLLGSIGVGFAIGKVAETVARSPWGHGFSTIFVALLFSTGLAASLGLSPLLTSLFFGVYMSNRSARVAEQLNALEPFEPVVYVFFFAMAGASLHLAALLHVGLLCGGYLLARSVGKGLGAALGGVLARCSRRIWLNVPLALVPQAGVAIGLVVLIGEETMIPAFVREMLGAVVLAAVTVNEILGPLLTQAALRRSREANKDRPRLIEFLQEEFILTGLTARDKWEAIRQMAAFLIRAHRTEHTTLEHLYATIVERENSMSTALGEGVAIPHGRLESGPEIQGVLGISRRGVDWGRPDGKPVHIVVLIATPKDHEAKHLQVLASLAAMVSDEAIRSRLIAAVNANDAWEIIEAEENRNYNYFIEEESEVRGPPAPLALEQ